MGWKVAYAEARVKNAYAMAYASFLTAHAEVSRWQLSVRNGIKSTSAYAESPMPPTTGLSC